MILASGVVLMGGCADPGWCTNTPMGTTTISVIGPKGQTVDGSYVQYGRRVPFGGAVPFSLTRTGISELELYKHSVDGPLVMGAQTDDRGWHSEVMSQAGTDVPGLKLRVDNGLAVERLVSEGLVTQPSQ